MAKNRISEPVPGERVFNLSLKPNKRDLLVALLLPPTPLWN